MYGLYWVTKETEFAHPAARGDEYSRLHVLVALIQRLKELIMGCGKKGKKPPKK